jgi:hypothetical protein
MFRAPYCRPPRARSRRHDQNSPGSELVPPVDATNVGRVTTLLTDDTRREPTFELDKPSQMYRATLLTAIIAYPRPHVCPATSIAGCTSTLLEPVPRRRLETPTAAAYQPASVRETSSSAPDTADLWRYTNDSPPQTTQGNAPPYRPIK